jgi:DNA-binding transcriptional regulator YiaG
MALKYARSVFEKGTLLKLIFNNPFCHPDYLIREVQRINNYFCEDPNPSNPKPNDEEVRNIVMQNYISFLNGELDFSKVVRTNPKTKKVSPKFVFKSKQFINIVDSITHLEAVRTFHEGKNAKNQKLFEQAINELQDGTKITQKRIANQMCISTRTIRRYMTDRYDELIRRYNSSLILIKRSKRA